MNKGRFYNLVDGIDRMMADIEGYFNPIISKLYPLFKIINIIDIGLVIFVFVALLFYMVFIRHHRVVNKLKDPANYFAAVILLVIYILLAKVQIKIYPETSFSLGIVIMPLAAKLFGPIIACAFGIIQYLTLFIFRIDGAFSFSAMLLVGISGMLYGWIIYFRRTSYSRCLWATLVVNVVCNILLVPMVAPESLAAEGVDLITQNIAENILITPIQALLIFIALVIMRKIRKELSHISWGLFE